MPEKSGPTVITPCAQGQSCPEIEKAKLSVYKELNGMLREAIKPLIREARASTEAIVVMTERLRVGAETFEAQSQRLEECENRIDTIESWRDIHDGRTDGYEKAARDSGRFWGLAAGAIGAVVNAFIAFFTFK